MKGWDRDLTETGETVRAWLLRSGDEGKVVTVVRKARRGKWRVATSMPLAT